jgi:2,4-dienoyl-CoA reductase-like NADH-dependent reductase (Old Yellow Enzyme family)
MSAEHPDLFSPLTLGSLNCKNRVVMAPLTRSRAGPGNVPNALNALYYAQRAVPASSSPKRRKSHPRARVIFQRRAFTAKIRSKAGES